MSYVLRVMIFAILPRCSRSMLVEHLDGLDQPRTGYPVGNRTVPAQKKVRQYFSFMTHENHKKDPIRIDAFVSSHRGTLHIFDIPLMDRNVDVRRAILMHFNF